MNAMFAPITGAWIETGRMSYRKAINLFAPITGAWIETTDVMEPVNYNVSHLSQVRGLKLPMNHNPNSYYFAPITGAWIETLKSQALSTVKLRTYHRCVD